MNTLSNDTPPSGLSSQEVEDRLRLHGYNELPSAKPRSIFAIAWEWCANPCFSAARRAGVIYLILGDSGKR